MQTVETFESMEKRNRKLQINPDFNESDFNSKVIETEDFIRKCLAASVNPVILCSFGKDSMVMMDMVRRIRKNTPVIFWREPFSQSKFDFPQKVASELDLVVYDYPPFATDYFQNNEYFEIFNYYTVGSSSIGLFTGCIPNDSENSLCGLMDLLGRPKCSGYDFQWDCIFHGHKRQDPLYISTPVPMNRVSHYGSGILTLPILEWTNEDIWFYIDKYNVPYNKERYEDGKESANSDYYKTCFRCLDYRNADKDIICPKSGKQIRYCGKTIEQHQNTKNTMLSRIYK